MPLGLDLHSRTRYFAYPMKHRTMAGRRPMDAGLDEDIRTAAESDVVRRRTGVYFQPFSNPLGTTRVLPYRLIGREGEPSDQRMIGALLVRS